MNILDIIDQPEETVKFHDLANIFPFLEENDLQELSDDIKHNGQQVTIKLLDGKILDGRNRYRACLRAGVNPTFEDVKVDDPLEYVISLNLHRRHLNESQRAWVAANIASNTQIYTQYNAAKMMNVSLRSVSSALSVRSKAIPELREAVQNGKIRVSAASKITNFDKETQKELVPLNKKDRLKAIKDKKFTDWDGKIKNYKVGVDFTEEQIKMIDAAKKRCGGESRSDFIQGIVVNHCENYMPPKQSELPHYLKGKPKHLKRSYTNKELTVYKSGASKEERDMAKEYEYFESTLAISSLSSSAEAINIQFDKYLESIGCGFSS